jgi:folate-binding protein YgfZ
VKPHLMAMAATTLSDRALVRLSGEDVRGFLQGLVTSDVAGPLPVWAGLLTPQGKCLFDFLVWPDRQGGDDLLLDCEAAAADDLVRRLGIYRLRRPIRIEREPALAVHWSIEGEGTPDPRLAELGNRWLAPPADAAAGWLEHRLRLGVTEGRAELGDVLWLECNAAELNGVSFSKGCFVGQENTARMNWRQKVNRRLVVVEAATPGPRTRIHYPELGLAVDHRRLDDLAGALRPEWLARALEPDAIQQEP